MQRRRSRRRSWGSSLRRFAPAGGCRGVSRRPIARAHDPFGSRWHLRDRFRLPPVRAHVSLAARPRPTVSVGGSTELIGFARARSIEDSRLDFWASLPSAVRARRRSSFAAGRSCLGCSSPLSGCCAMTDVCLALATRTLSPSVACRAMCAPLIRAPGGSVALDEPRHSPGTSAARSVTAWPSFVCDGTCQDQRQAIPMTCFPVTDCLVARIERPTWNRPRSALVVREAFRDRLPV